MSDVVYSHDVITQATSGLSKLGRWLARLYQKVNLGWLRGGSIAAWLMAFGLIAEWTIIWYSLDGQLRLGPIQLTEKVAAHRNLFAFAGILWFALHLLLVPVIIGIFTASRAKDSQRTSPSEDAERWDSQGRPALWAFAALAAIAALLWMSFGALSVPLGTNAGPDYAKALNMAHLNAGQRAAMTERAEPGSNAPRLLTDPALLSQLGDAQRIYVQHAWAMAQDAWVIRKVSDAMYFSGNAVFAVALVFFFRFALLSRVMFTYTAVYGLLAGVLLAFGFLAFVPYYDLEIVLKAAIALQILWLMLVGGNLWEAWRATTRTGEKPISKCELGADVTFETVAAVSRVPDPVIRNLLITEVYSRLGRNLRARFAVPGESVEATWLDYAVWASLGVNDGIRGQQFGSVFEELGEHIEIGTWQSFCAAADGRMNGLPVGRITDVPGLTSAALAAGNLLVFSELAPAFIRLRDFDFDKNDHAFQRDVLRWLPSETRLTPTMSGLMRFVRRAKQRRFADNDGDLRSAFALYREARAAGGARRTELTFLANLQVVLYEQKRLQHLLEEACRAPVAGTVLACIWPKSLVDATFNIVHLPFRWIFGTTAAQPEPMAAQAPAMRSPLGDKPALRVLIGPSRFPIRILRFLRDTPNSIHRLAWRTTVRLFSFLQRRLVADTITMSVGSRQKRRRPVILRPNQRLQNPGAPRALRNAPSDPRLETFLADWDRNRPGTVPTVNPTKVMDYTDIGERMNFIVDFFRRYQQEAILLENPFGPGDLKDIMLGNLPSWVHNSRRGLPLDSSPAARADGLVAGIPA